MTIESLSDKEYRALELESYSSLKYLLDSPAAYIYNKQNPFTGNDSTLLGTAVHHILQGNSHLVINCPIDKRKRKEYEEWLRMLQETKHQEEETIIVPNAIWQKLEQIKESIEANANIKDVLYECVFEIPKKGGYNGVVVKGKADAFNPNCFRIIEIKTSSLATDLTSFREEAVDRHYDVQADLYCKLYGATSHMFIVVNTQPPFKVAVYKSGNAFLKGGAVKGAEMVRRYLKYIINGEKYEPGIEEL